MVSFFCCSEIANTRIFVGFFVFLRDPFIYVTVGGLENQTYPTVIGMDIDKSSTDVSGSRNGPVYVHLLLGK